MSDDEDELPLRVVIAALVVSLVLWLLFAWGLYTIARGGL